MTDDAELLRRYATGGAEEAFAELVRRHIDLVYSVALRQVGGDAHLAEDVAQTVFTALARKAGDLSHRAVLGGWLYRGTQFAACDAVRAERRRRAREQEAHTMQENAPAIEPDWEKLRPLLDAAIGELAEKDRDAVWLRYFDQQSFAAIGARLQLSENAARMRVERALDKLHTLLSRRGVTSTTAALALALPGQLGAATPAGLAATLTHSVLAGVSGTAASAATGWTLFHLMSSTKVAIGIATAVSVAALGTAFYESQRAQTALDELARARQSSATLQRRISELERQLADHVQRDTAKPAAVAAPTTTKPGAAGAAASAGAAEEPITRETVSQRLARARELDRQGNFEAALAEYLWCYDVGTPRIASFAPIRAALPHEIAKLGERFSPALSALRERRDAAVRRLLAGGDDPETAMSLRSLNRSLKEDQRSLELHDRLPADDPRRTILGGLLFDEFTVAQRYREAAVATPYSSMSGQFETMIGRETKGAAPALPDPQRQHQRSFAIRTAAKHIEVLVGSGDLEHATDLALRVLDHDASPATLALLEKHVARAGRPGLLAALHRE